MQILIRVKIVADKVFRIRIHTVIIDHKCLCGRQIRYADHILAVDIIQFIRPAVDRAQFGKFGVLIVLIVKRIKQRRIFGNVAVITLRFDRDADKKAVKRIRYVFCKINGKSVVRLIFWLFR